MNLNTQLEYFYMPSVNKGHTSGDKIMIVLHGLGDSLESYKVIAKEINVTGLQYLLVNAPRGYFFGYSWYDLPPGDPGVGLTQSREIIKDLVLELIDKGYESKDILLMGFSQGGAVVLDTSYILDMELGGIAALSPRIYPNRLPESVNSMTLKTPLFIAHGKYDDVIPFSQTKEGSEYLESLGFKCSFNDYEMAHEIDPMEIIDLRSWINDII